MAAKENERATKGSGRVHTVTTAAFRIRHLEKGKKKKQKNPGIQETCTCVHALSSRGAEKESSAARKRELQRLLRVAAPWRDQPQAVSAPHYDKSE